MTIKRYYQRDFEELYYIIDSNVISEKEFDEKVMYDGYTAFEDSMTGDEIVNLLNEHEELKQSYKEIFNELGNSINRLYRNGKITFDERAFYLKKLSEFEERS